jgi:hypothetical protein
MPSTSEKQRKYIFYLRGKYKTKTDTPESEKWIWDSGWNTVKEKYIKFFKESTSKETFYKEISKVLIPFGFHNNCITEITRRFFDEYQDLDYNGIINDLLENWDMDVVTAQNVFKVAEKLNVIINKGDFDNEKES